MTTGNPSNPAPRWTDCGGGLCEQYGVWCDECANYDPSEGIKPPRETA